jgi:hypothetical protein
MLLRITKQIHFFTGMLPLLWVISFLIFVIASHFFQDVPRIITTVTFYLFIAAFQAMWVWLLLVIIISLLQRKIYFNKLSVTLFVTGTIISLIIFFANPGDYMWKLLQS